MVEVHSFRIPRPLSEVWRAMSVALTSLYVDEHIGEVPSMHRYSVYVTGWRAFIVVTTLGFESEHSTLLSITINPRPYTTFGAKAKFRQAEAQRIFGTLVQILSPASGTEGTSASR